MSGRDIFDTVPAGILRSRAQRTRRPLTMDELRHTRVLAARLVVLWGEQYKPIFDAVEGALKDREQQMGTLEHLRALAITG